MAERNSRDAGGWGVGGEKRHANFKGDDPEPTKETLKREEIEYIKIGVVEGNHCE
jgi:hypothetical protein